MEFRELLNFSRVARAGSVSRAAAELRLAQPALSRQIRKLEHELGAELFVRHGRGMRLSAAGSRLLARAEEITALMAQTRQEIRDDQSRARPRITVGVVPGAGRMIVPDFAARFQDAWPGATLHLREGVSNSLQEWLLEKRIDIATLHNPPHLESLAISPILRERMWVVGPPKYAGKSARRNASFRIRDIAELPLILPNMTHSNRQLVERAAHEHGIRLRIKIEADSVTFAKALVEKGLGFTILTYSAVQDEVRTKRLAIFPIARPVLLTQVAIVALRGKDTSPLMQATSDLLHDVCRGLVRSRSWSGAQLG